MRKKLLNLESHLHVKMNNNIVDAHEIVRAPALYEYDSVYKQIATLDDELTSTRGFNSQYRNNRVEIYFVL